MKHSFVLVTSSSEPKVVRIVRKNSTPTATSLEKCKSDEPYLKHRRWSLYLLTSFLLSISMFFYGIFGTIFSSLETRLIKATSQNNLIEEAAFIISLTSMLFCAHCLDKFDEIKKQLNTTKVLNRTKNSDNSSSQISKVRPFSRTDDF